MVILNYSLAIISKVLVSGELFSFLQKSRVDWKHILPKSPWWGGFYERMVRVVKSSLRKVLGNARLTFEEMSTVLTEIEMTVNSRPITYLYENNEVEALCPSHLMIGRRLKSNSLIDNEQDEIVDLTNNEFNRRMQYLESLLNMYWKRFRTDYLSELREQHIYTTRKPGKTVLSKDDVVLINDSEKVMVPRGKWKKGIVSRLIAGRDGQIRGAVIKCIVSGKYVEYERPVERLVPFELIPDSSNSTIEIEIESSNDVSSESSDSKQLSNSTESFKSVPRIRRRAAVSGEQYRQRTKQV